MNSVSGQSSSESQGAESSKTEMEDTLLVTPKTEPGVTSQEAVTRPSVVVSASVAQSQEQANMVYCSLNDLDDQLITTVVSERQHVIGDTVVTSNTNQQQILQMVQSVPGLQISNSSDKSQAAPYSAVQTILLHGGILQLKPEGGQIVSTVTGSTQAQPQTIALDPHVIQKLAKPELLEKVVTHELVKGGEENMVATQGGRPQDAIAGILASMNSGGAELDIASAETAPEIVPLNLATSAGHITSLQHPVQVSGYRKLASSQVSPVSSGGLVSKKVIIATINGQQRILTPVSSPQLIALKSPNGGSPRLVTADSLASPLTIIQKPVIQKQIISNPISVNSSQHNRTSDNKTCRWKFENGQICGKQFTKTYNLTVHMRMHQDIRPFPCTICEQTFRQKAHLQRHEATHGIDSTAGRKRRKKSLLMMSQEGGRNSESEEEEANSELMEIKRTKGATVKTESDPLDPMIEPIDGDKKLCPVTVGTNTDAGGHKHTMTDDIEEDMEPVNRYKGGQVEQGVQYNEEDLLPQEPLAGDEASSVAMTEFIQEPEDDKTNLKTELVYANQSGQYVSENGDFIEDPQATTQLIAADGSLIDASSNHLVMSDGALVSLVPCDQSVEQQQQQENVVNIVTSTATNEQGQQIIIIDNLDQHSPELQREIMNALLADHTIVPISQ